MVQFTSGADGGDVASNSIDVIVAAFLQKFGDQAAEVAARQVMQATAETLDVWLTIAAKLSGSAAPSPIRPRRPGRLTQS
jgi:hypothetical protein